MNNLSSIYNAAEFEDQIYQTWEKEEAFTPKIDKKKKPFVISMPPPNATGTLHLGHATMLAIEDIMIRYHRMLGESTLWLPGTDHASIATQNKVEKEIAKRGLTRQKLGRQEFLKEVHQFVKNSQHIIRTQIRKMGSSCDWSRERYTLDEGLTEAVQAVFKKMYHDGLIYRGHRIVNWCPRCGSTLADDEVEYKEQETKFYYFRYGPVIIGTARPETKFLDKIIIVHPKDKRYKKYISQEIEVEWIEGKIKAKFLADLAADPDFGSGAMTITPAHSFVDFEIAKKHKLDIVQIIDEQGNLTSAAGEFAGRNACEAREDIVKKLDQKGLVAKIDHHYKNKLSVCYRCGTAIEPLVSKQWFIDVNKPIIKEGKKKISIKENAIKVVKNGQIKIIPGRFNKIYYHWMNNLRDWCISRQIWFGHRIPAWQCENPNCSYGQKATPIVPKLKKNNPTKCPKCQGKIKRDPDTLDTWFSSGLWTFSTLGWPNKTADLKYFHPTSVMETGYDILFFWIARMIIMTTYNLGEIPFRTVYLHGLVRDKEGRKMSKSLNNGIDPLDMIAKYGADSVRLSLIIGSTPGNDIRLYEEKIASFRNFVNKIWNASRFVLMKITPEDLNRNIDLKNLSHSDQWILSKTQTLIKKVTDQMNRYQFSDAGNKLYDFIWSEFCDWYLEICKINVQPAVLIYVLKTILQLLHPFTPFVTEAVWKLIDQKTMLIESAWPVANKKYSFPKAQKEINLICKIIKAIRSVRAESKIEVSRKIDAVIYGHKFTDLIKKNDCFITRLANLNSIEIIKAGTKISDAVSKFVDEIEIYLPLSGLMDCGKECQRINRDIEKTKKNINFIQNKLNNKNFVEKAPTQVVENEQNKLEKQKKELTSLEEQLKVLNQKNK